MLYIYFFRVGHSEFIFKMKIPHASIDKLPFREGSILTIKPRKEDKYRDFRVISIGTISYSEPYVLRYLEGTLNVQVAEQLT